jgi:parallel beta-helix repeat protein
MRSHIVSKWLWWTFIISLSPPILASTYYQHLFEKGVYMMEAQGDLKGAIPIFEEIVKRHPYDRAYAALSQLYIGLCYKRQGLDQASPALLDVIKEFPDQAEVVKIAEAELSSLSPPPALANPPAEKSFPVLLWSGKSIWGAKTLAPDGRFFVCFDIKDGNMGVFDLTGKKRRPFPHNGQDGDRDEYPEGAAFSPDSSRIAYSWHSRTGRSELWLGDIAGTRRQCLLRVGGPQRIFPIGWSKDAGRILVRMSDPDFTAQICSVSISKGTLEVVKDFGSSWPEQMRLSPDGRYLAYIRLREGLRPERAMFLLNIADKQEIPMAVRPGDHFLLGWSPDGGNILFASETMGKTDAWALSIWKGQPRPPARLVRSDIGHFSSLGLTPDGSLLLEMEKPNAAKRTDDSSPSGVYVWPDFFTQKSHTLTVPDDFPTIQAAVSAAGSGDTIFIRNGVYEENIILGKSLTLQGEDPRETVLDGKGRGSVIQVTSNHVHLSGLTLRNGWDGIHLTSRLPVHHLTIGNCVITKNSGQGILIRNGGGHHLVENCTLSHNAGYAVNAHQFSRSIIRDCKVFANGGGLRVGWGWYIQVAGNHVSKNMSSGIYPDSCYYSTIENNLIYANRRMGIKMGYISSRNTIRENIIMGHDDGILIGLEWGGYSKNRFYHNDLIENRQAVFETEKGLAGFQHWDNGRPGGGNFWSDYAGQDKNKDGIGDEPYEPAVGARDHSPRTTPQHILAADITFDPLRQKFQRGTSAVTIILKLPAQIPAELIDASTLRLNDKLSPKRNQLAFVDSDNDGVSELKVDLDLAKTVRILPDDSDSGIKITGKLKNGLFFAGRFSLGVNASQNVI